METISPPETTEQKLFAGARCVEEVLYQINQLAKANKLPLGYSPDALRTLVVEAVKKCAELARPPRELRPEDLASLREIQILPDEKGVGMNLRQVVVEAYLNDFTLSAYTLWAKQHRPEDFDLIPTTNPALL